MADKEVLKGNRLIAEFMGGVYIPKNKWVDEGGIFKTNEVVILEEPFKIQDLKYHTSWDWLVPVVEKIEKDFAGEVEVIIYSASCYIQKWDGKKYESFISGVGNKKEAVYSAVIQFITWYNSQTTKTIEK